MGDAEEIKVIVDSLRKRGFEYTARYIEMFGVNNRCPWFWIMDEDTVKFYKRCVEEGHPWDWYLDPPGDHIIL